MTPNATHSPPDCTMFCWILLLVTGSALAAANSCNIVLVKNTMVSNCMAQGHFTIPDISPSTEVILLSFNNITYLKESSFPPLGSAKTLTLGMQLAGKLYIGDSAFGRLRNLTFLDLGGNKNLRLHDKAFAGLGKLEVLLLDHNEMRDVVLQKGYFKDLLLLKKLDLSGNQIQMVRPDPSFHALKMLQSLHLKLNKIDALCGEDFQHLRGHHLSLLDLSSNNLSYRQLRMSQQNCTNPFYNITIDNLDISSNPWNVEGAGNFFKIIAGTQVRFLQMQHSSSLGSSFGFKNIKDINAATFSGLNKSNVLSLDLSEGFISRLSPMVFACLPQLLSLNVASNKIHRLDKEAFSGLHNLQILNLSYNLLGELYRESFEGLKSSPLQYLDLKSNHIGAIQNNAFSDLISLQSLNLGDNSLTTIPSMQLLSLKHVFLGENRIMSAYGIRSFAGSATLIDLSYNRLQDLGEFWKIITIRTLEHLFLSHNMISRCFTSPEDLIPEDNNLRILDLSHNSLGKVWTSGACLNIFHNLKKLISLDLSQNHITTLPENLLQGLVSLQNLQLSSNSMASIPNQLFQGLTSLNFLRLNSNSFITLSPVAWMHLPLLKFLDLKDTSFICHCGLLDFATWMMTTNMTLGVPKENIACRVPQKSLQDTPIFTYVERNCVKQN